MRGRLAWSGRGSVRSSPRKSPPAAAVGHHRPQLARGAQPPKEPEERERADHDRIDRWPPYGRRGLAPQVAHEVAHDAQGKRPLQVTRDVVRSNERSQRNRRERGTAPVLVPIMAICSCATSGQPEEPDPLTGTCLFQHAGPPLATNPSSLVSPGWPNTRLNSVAVREIVSRAHPFILCCASRIGGL